MYTTTELFAMASEPDAAKEAFLNNVTLSIEDDVDGCVDLDAEKVRLENIWALARMPFTELVNTTGLTQTSFARAVGIPLRTIQNWCIEQRSCPVYIRFLLAEHFKLL